MPNWKKVVTSGSNAHFNNITASAALLDGAISSSAGTSAFEKIITSQLRFRRPNINTALNSIIEHPDRADEGDIVFSIPGDISASGDMFLSESLHFGTQTPNSNTNIDIYANGRDLYFRSASTSQVKFSLGNTSPAIGIGNTNPTHTLTVEGDISASGDVFVDDITADDIVADSVRIGDVSGNSLKISETTDGANFFAAGASMAVQMAITSPGGLNADDIRVGIGRAACNNADKMLTVNGSISSSGALFIDGKIHMDQTAGQDIDLSDTSMLDFGRFGAASRLGASGADMYLLADTDLYLGPDNDLIIRYGDDGYATFFGAEKSLHIGTDTTNSPNETLNIVGSISASGDLFLGVATGSFISASAEGNIQISGSGRGEIQVDYRTFDTGSSHLSSAGGAVGDIVKFGQTSGLTAGDIYYLKIDGSWGPAQANAAGTASGSLAVALGSSAVTDGMLLKGMVKLDNDPATGMGAPVFLDDTTAGHARATAPDTSNDVVRIVGHYYGNSGLVYFNPDNTFIEVA